MLFCKMNFTNAEQHSFEVIQVDLFVRIISGIIWFFLEIPCNFLLFGLVQFDRLGGDPLKRRITDQVRFYNLHYLIHFG